MRTDGTLPVVLSGSGPTMNLPPAVFRGLRVWEMLRGEHRPYRVIRGGRVSGKSRALAKMMIAKTFLMPGRQFFACRATKEAISSSLKVALMDAARSLGVGQVFGETERRLVNRVSGSIIEFKGTERSRESIRGWEQIGVVWVEEAQTMSAATARILVPTVARFPGSEIWITFNPREPTDWVWRRFVESSRADDLVLELNWRDNPWFPAAAEVERQAALSAGERDLYAHTWEGALLPRAGGFRVLPADWIDVCCEADAPDGSGRVGQVGYDPGAGGDASGICGRRGPVVEDLRAIGGVGRHVSDALRALVSRLDAQDLWFDAGVVVQPPPQGEAWMNHPVLFGGKVRGPRTPWNRSVNNRARFSRRNSQLAWAVRMRAHRTVRRYRDGEAGISAEQCLFLPSDLSAQGRRELSQPVWREDGASRVEIRKAREGERSPNLFDALCLAFARDSRDGLTDGDRGAVRLHYALV